MIKILAIGNSFSQDATAYLYNIAKAGGFDIKVVNLYIGGCSLETHWKNVVDDLENYDYELNGSCGILKISIKEALLEEDWDFVTLQQASHDSGLSDTYYPFMIKLSEYVKHYASNAKQLIHQTWAYDINSTHNAFDRYDNDQNKMYTALTDAYTLAAKKLKTDLIPCGKVIQTLRTTTEEFDFKIGQTLCRDGYHMSIPYGRFALAATWYETILHGNILDNGFLPPIDGIIDTDKINIIKTVVHKICSESK